MAKRSNNLQRLNDKTFYSRDEEEIFNYDYEGISDTQLMSGINSSIKSNHPEDSSKENVELSLEVEIADSLKHLIASPDHQSSDLLDVTIVRPTDLDFVRGLDTTNTLAFKGTEVRNLIASMERQKLHKKKLIEECKKKVVASKINTETIKQNNPGSKHAFRRNEEKETHKRRLKRTENSPCGRNITVMSAPPKCSLHLDYKLDKNKPIVEEILKYKVGEVYTNSAPIAILKPLVGEIKESLKHLEASITQIGDGSSNNSELKHYEKRFTSASGTNVSKDNSHTHDNNRYVPDALQDKHQPTHQIYAAANNYGKIRKLLACQNADRRNHDNDKPCLCQHCGMVGLLIESQKRPIMQPTPAKRPDTCWPKNDCPTKTQKQEHDTRKEVPRNSHADKMKISDDNFWIFRDLASRLEALEIRVAAQEQRAVPKDYFKRIINKLWHRHTSDSLQTMQVNLERTQQLKDHSTQYSGENLENALKAKKETKTVKHRNVQIQQNTKRNYCVNPVLVTQTDLENKTQSNDSQELGSNNSVGTKTINAISEFFSKKPETIKKYEESTSKEKSSAMESFWRWGEEIIKPGFDLKIKIMSLLDERFQSIKNVNQSDNKDTSSKKPDFKMHTTQYPSPKSSSANSNFLKTHSPKTNTLKTNVHGTNSNYKGHITSENLYEAPLPFEDKEIAINTDSAKNYENVNVPNSSSRALKKMLDMMSEKIYKDHVKPTVDAIKQEQKSFNCENTKQIYNIKAAMDAALCQMNPKDPRVSTPLSTNEATHEGQEWRKDFLEPLEIPTSFKNFDGDFNDSLRSPKQSKKSSIPIRVCSPSPMNLACERNLKYTENRRSLIPCLKLPVKNWSDVKLRGHESKPAKSLEKSQKREKRESQHKNTRKHHTTEVKLKKDKRVVIKYINPKAENWNEESGGSIETEISAENKQVMLTDKSHKYEKLRDSNTEEKRRISHKHSVTDKLAFLTKLTKAEMGKADIWNNILKQVKNHCRSKQDTVIIQIPSKTHKHEDIGVTEVEFTIEDIEKLATSSKLNASAETMPQATIDSNNMESFLLIRSRKILEEVHKRLGNSFQRK